jgi:hypothetical protein
MPSDYMLSEISRKLSTGEPLTDAEKLVVKGSSTQEIVGAKPSMSFMQGAPRANTPPTASPVTSQSLSNFAPLTKPDKVALPTAPSAVIFPEDTPAKVVSKPPIRPIDSLPPKPIATMSAPPMADIPESDTPELPIPSAPKADAEATKTVSDIMKAPASVDKKLDAVQTYLASQPKGDVLMGILDAVFSGMAAFAGREQKTQAQIRKDMERQNVLETAQAERALQNQLGVMGAQQGYTQENLATAQKNTLESLGVQQGYNLQNLSVGQQNRLQEVALQLENQIKALESQARIARIQGDRDAENDLRNSLAQSKADYDYTLLLIAPQTQSAIDVAQAPFKRQAEARPNASASASGVTGVVTANQLADSLMGADDGS